jgi:hypothetical protein
MLRHWPIVRFLPPSAPFLKPDLVGMMSCPSVGGGWQGRAGSRLHATAASLLFQGSSHATAAATAKSD